jgi:hypothetical protein
MKLEIQKIDQNSFSSFINRMKLIDNFIYFKIEGGNQVVSVAYLPQRDAVKMHTCNVSDLFAVDNVPTDKPLRIAFFDANKVLEAFRMFDADAIQGTINFMETDSDYVASSLVLHNDELEITLACSEPSLGFKDLTQAQINGIFSREGTNFNFDVDVTSINKIKSLFNLDKEEIFNITAKKGVKVTGKTFNWTVNPEAEGEGDVALYKKYINLIDREEQTVLASSNKVMFASKDSQTILTIATCQTND